jgi:hypothetical protein
MNELEEEGLIDDELVGDTSGDIDLNFVLEVDEESPIVTSSSSFDHDHHILGSEARLSGRRQQQQQLQQGQPQPGPRHTLLPSQVPLGPSVSPQTFFRNAVIQFNRDGSGSSETSGKPDQYGTGSLPTSSRFVPSFTPSRLDSSLTESDPGDHAFYDSGSSDAFFLPSGLIGSDLDLDPQMQMQLQLQLQQLQLQKQHQYQLQLQQLRYGAQQGSLPPTNHFARQPSFTPSSSYPPFYDQDTFESELDQSADDLCWDDLTTFVDHLDSPHRSHSNPSELRRPNTPPRFINISNPTPVQQRSNERPAGRVGVSPPQTIGVSMNFAPELTRNANSPPSPTGGLPFPANNQQPTAFNPPTSYHNRKNQYVSSGPGLLSNPPPTRGGGPGRFQGRGGMKYPPRGGFVSQNNNQQPLEMGRYRHNSGRGTSLTPLPASKGQQHGPKGTSPPSSVNRPKSLPAPLSPPPPPHSTQVQFQAIQPQPPKRKETHEADRKKIATPQSSSAPQLPQLPPALMPKTPTPASPPQVPDKRVTPVKSVIASAAPSSPTTDSSRRSPSAASSKPPTKRDLSEGTKDVKENKEPPTQAETKTTKRNNKTSNVAGSSPTKISPRSSGANSLPSSPVSIAEIDTARATTSTDTNQPTSSLASSTEQATHGTQQKDSKSKQSQRPTSVATPNTTVTTTTPEEPAAKPGKTRKGKTTSSAPAATISNVPPRNASLEKNNQTSALTSPSPSPSPSALTSAVVALGQKKLIGPVVLFFVARIVALLAVFSLINAGVRRVVKSVLNFHKTAFKALTRSYYVTFTFFYVYFFPWFAYSLKSLTHQAPTVSWYIFLAWFLMTKRCCNMPNLRLLPLLFVFDGRK